MRKAEKNAEELRSENLQLEVENDFLTTSQKNTSDRYTFRECVFRNLVYCLSFGFRMHSLSTDLERIRGELKEEKEKVKNLSAWREQVREKNESLVMENVL